METKIHEVAPGVYQLHMPLPMRPSIVNVYLVRDEDEWALIDTGMHSEESIETFQIALAQVGCPLTAIRQIFCTHHHVDHFGTSRLYKELTGATVFLNALEVPRIERMQSNTPLPEAVNFFRSHGVPIPDSPDAMPTPGRYFGTLYAPIPPDQHLHDGDVLHVGKREIQVVWTPGHTAGHCCFYLPQDKVMIVGDHLLPKITPHVGVYYFGPDNPLHDFLNSQQKVQQFDVNLVLPAHGGIFKDHRHRAQQIIQHHKYRLQEMLDVIRRGHARTAYDVALEVFGLPPDRPIFHTMAATFETLAHLHLLMYDGKARRLEEDNKVKFVAQ